MKPESGEAGLRNVPKVFSNLLRRWRNGAASDMWCEPTSNGDGDCGWWYGERAAVSQLAGAAWQAKGWAMQEYAWNRNKSYGRVDLCVHVGPLKFVAEAKQLWPNLRSSRELVEDRIEDAFAGAGEQLEGVPKDEYDRVPLVFISPRIHKPENFDDRIVAFLDILTELTADKRTACVWTFPKWSRSNTFKEARGARFYPGAVLLARYEKTRAGRATKKRIDR